MKRNEMVQIKGLNINKLKDKAKSLKMEIYNLTLDSKMKKLKDVKLISKRKKDLAQVLTILRQKELLGELESKVERGGKSLK
ncbi:50S ribosomal protein L29 [Candidatus Daviesbacteria bacterium]|nr:50S ribosomal protein L29 [Candidatus Daviesbacteria bacterium]